MRKLKIGVWLPNNYSPEEGGGFGYLYRLIEGLYSYNFQNANIIFLSKGFPQNWDKYSKSYEIQTKEHVPPTVGYFTKIINRIKQIFRKNTEEISPKMRKEQYKKNLEGEIQKIVDIVYFLTPYNSEIDLNLPFIYTLWDLGHLTGRAFPELIMNGNFEWRNKHFLKYPYKAMTIFAESETGKNEIVSFLKIPKEKIKVVNLVASGVVSKLLISQKPTLIEENNSFIHYPAQFWAHKNHYNLIYAFKEVLKTYPNLKLILTGSDKGNKKYIKDLIKSLELEKNIADLGFISMNELKWLYENSNGLVMPTLLGPTNMPLLEAAELNCKVACSNLPGHIEQLGDYAFYFDPLDFIDISRAILDMLESNNPLYQAKFTFDTTLTQIDNSFIELNKIRNCWS